MKVGVLGLGRVGMLHASILRATRRVDALIVADVDANRGRAAAAELGADWASDPIAAIEASDAVVIATPPATHIALVTAAIAGGRPAFCEKPLAENLGAAIELAARVEAAGVPVQVGFHRRFDPGYAAARALMERGDLGRLHLIRLQVTEPGLPPSTLTNLFRNTAIHDFDLVRWLSAAEATSVFVEGADRAGGRFDPRLDPDTIVAALKLDNGALAAITVSRLSPRGYDVRAELVGSRDHIAVGWTDHSPIHSVEPDAVTRHGDYWRSWQDRFAVAYRAELEAFLAAASGEWPVRVTVRDGVEAQRLSEAARSSLETGERIVLVR